MTAPVTDPLRGKRVLLVEDEYLIAMDAETMLKSLGATNVCIASTYEDAEKKVSQAAHDVAVLDVNLNGKMSFPLGEALKARGVPFVFATGYNLEGRLREIGGVLWVNKPYRVEELKVRLMQALEQS